MLAVFVARMAFAASDDKVRPEHAVLNDTTLPIDDPFWNSYLPPLDWGCRCTTVQVSRNKYSMSNSQEACAAGERATALPKQKIFRFNPGKDKVVFPPKHPYFPKGCGDCKVKTMVHLATPVDGAMPQCKVCTMLFAQCLKDNKQRINIWKNEYLPQEHSSLSFDSDKLCSGSLLITRGSIRGTINHTQNLAVRNTLLSLEESVRKWEYVGWAECKIDKATGKRKHLEAEYFIYYKMTIAGKTYYASVKANRGYMREELYCIREYLDLNAIQRETPPHVENYKKK